MASIPITKEDVVVNGINGTNGANGASPTIPQQYDVIIVGAGFSGIANLHRLRSDGLKCHIYEAGSDFGGVWYWNRYPGARVDSEAPFYQLNIPEVYTTFNFTQRFPDHRELRRYMAHVDKILGLRKDVDFNSKVNSATWDAERGEWNVRTENGLSGRAKYLILASGLLHERFTPDFPGVQDYKGVIHHSRAWPEDTSVKGKKVAVIGAGATSVQIVQEVAKEADELTMLMRRPSYCLPMGQREWTEEEQHQLRAYYPVLFAAGRNSAVGFPVKKTDKRVQDVPEEEREKYLEEIWGAGGFQFLLRNYNNVVLDLEANKIIYDFWKKKVRTRLTDPQKASLMAPDTAPYYFSTKRTPLEHDYYDILNLPHVFIVDLNAHPINRFVPSGLQLANESAPRDFDMIIFATGFDSFTGSLTSMGLTSKHGVDIKDVWKDGVKTYLGMLISGFPNAFMVYTPQAPTALSNGPTILEAQTSFIADTIAALNAQGAKSIEATEDAAREWGEGIDKVVDKTLYKFTDSWWNGGNVPGKQKSNMTYIGGIDGYERECRGRMVGWRGFVVESVQP